MSRVAYRTYELTFTGQAGSTARAEFEDCEIIVGPQSTTLRAELPDQSALAGLIERLLALRCELVRVDRLPARPGGQRLPDAGHSPAFAQLAGETGSVSVLDTVNRLFSVGLSLTNVRGLVGPGTAADRLADAIGELDDTIRDIRTAAFGHAAGRRRADQLVDAR